MDITACLRGGVEVGVLGVDDVDNGADDRDGVLVPLDFDDCGDREGVPVLFGDLAAPVSAFSAEPRSRRRGVRFDGFTGLPV